MSGAVERPPPPDFKALFEEKYQGRPKRSIALPFFEPMPHAEFLNNLASGGHSMHGRFGYGRLVGEDDYVGWTMFYLFTGQGGGWTGEGMLVRYATDKGAAAPLTGRFWICKHERVSTSSLERQQRGDHRGYCKLCGLDLSYDSGD